MYHQIVCTLCGLCKKITFLVSFFTIITLYLHVSVIADMTDNTPSRHNYSVLVYDSKSPYLLFLSYTPVVLFLLYERKLSSSYIYFFAFGTLSSRCSFGRSLTCYWPLPNCSFLIVVWIIITLSLLFRYAYYWSKYTCSSIITLFIAWIFARKIHRYEFSLGFGW